MLDDLAALVARAVANGDLDFASALIDAKRKSALVAAAQVADFAAERTERGKP